MIASSSSRMAASSSWVKLPASSSSICCGKKRGLEERAWRALGSPWEAVASHTRANPSMGGPVPSNTYPLVLNSLLGLVQDPLHLLYGHHLRMRRFQNCSVRPMTAPWQGLRHKASEVGLPLVLSQTFPDPEQP